MNGAPEWFVVRQSGNSLLRGLRKLCDPGITLGLLFRIAQVEDGWTRRDIARLAIKCVKDFIPKIVCDSVVALFIVEMMQQVKPLNFSKKLKFGDVMEVLNAVAEFIHERRSQAGGKGGGGPLVAGYHISDREGDDRDGWKGGIKCSEEYAKVIGILVVVVMYPFP